MKKLLTIVVPAYNEALNIPLLYKKIVALEGGWGNYLLEFVFVDDGSKDDTLGVIKKIAKKDSRVRYVSFARNFYHQYALKAGLDYARGEAVISMDADLQHPPELIGKMIKQWERGYEVVYTIRKFSGGSWFKKLTSRWFYGLINTVSSVKIEDGVADFRLLDRKVVNVIKNLPERSIFLRGLIGWCGFRSKGLKYSPGIRKFGRTTYSLKKMLLLAMDGITSFSVWPLQLSAWIGIIMAGLSFCYLVYALLALVFGWGVFSGWTSVIGSVLFLGGIQLIMLGVVGVYIGQLFLEMKHRPQYIVRETNIVEARK